MVNGDLNPIKSYVSNADVVTTIRNLISLGQKNGIILFIDSTGLPDELSSGNVAYIKPSGTETIYLEYKWEQYRYYGYILGKNTAPVWNKYILNSDLASKIQCGLSSIGSVSAGESTSEIAFARPFLTAPKSVVGNISHIEYGGNLSMQISGITQTGFSVYIKNDSGKSLNISVYWIACLD